MNVYQQAKDINNYFLNVLAPAFAMAKTQYRKRPIVCVGVDPENHNMLRLYMMINSKSHIGFSFQVKSDWNVDDYVAPLFKQLWNFGVSSIHQWRDNTTTKQHLHDNVLGTAAMVFTILQGMLVHSEFMPREQAQLIVSTGDFDVLVDSCSGFLYEDLLPVEDTVHSICEDLVLYIGSADASIVETDPGMDYDIERGKGDMITFLGNLEYDQVSMRMLFNQMVLSIVYAMGLSKEYDGYNKYLVSGSDSPSDFDGVDELRSVLIDFLMYLSPQLMKVMSHSIDPKYSKEQFVKIPW